MNLLPTVAVKNIWSSTSAAVGSTGDAAGTTAGSTQGDSTTIGGFPFTSTGIDMQGYDGVVFKADIAGSSGSVLKATFSNLSSTVSSTSWTDFPSAYVASGTESTAFHSLVLDVVRPTKRFVTATVQVPSSSAVVLSVTAIQYR